MRLRPIEMESIERVPRFPPVTAALIANFVTTYLLSSFDDPVDTPAFHHEAWELVCRDNKQVALAAPRDHAKSTGITFAYVLCMLLFRATRYPVIISNTHKKAIAFVQNIKRALQDNEAIKSTFRFSHFEKEAEDDFIAVFKDGHKFRVSGLGFGMSVRGLNWNTMRPDMAIGDDMEDDEQVLSPERREKALDWWLAALRPAISRRGRLRVVGTIVHTASLLQGFIDDEQSWLSRVWEAHDDEFNNILWPEKFDAAYFRALRGQFERAGKLDKYNMEYRNKAYDTSSGLFREEHMLPITDSDWLLLDKNQWPRVVGGDFAITVKQKRDYTVFIIAVLGPEYLYVVDVRKKRMESKAIVDEMFDIEVTHRLRTGGHPLQWFEEDGAIRKALDYSLETRMKKASIYLSLCPMNPGTTDKRTRSMAIRARFAARAVKVDKEASWWPDFRQELLEFDRGAHDDQVDALSWIGIGLSQMTEPMTEEEEEEEEYFTRCQQTKKHEGGRNKTTGY